jgi:cytochrome c oxidase cbb3-type subunit III
MIDMAFRSKPWLAFALCAAAGLAGCGADDGTASGSAEQKASLQAMSSAYVNDTLESIQASPDAMALGGDLYKAHCSGCHGAEGHGAKGITDLTRGKYNYGATADAVRATIRDGRRSEMPDMGHEYGELELGQIVAFVQSLSKSAPLSDYEQHGRDFYLESCASCHGPDGHGQTATGAPNLADDYWVNGQSMMNLRLAITRGVVSVCPPQGVDLTPIEIELLTAYTLALIKA